MSFLKLASFKTNPKEIITAFFCCLFILLLGMDDPETTDDDVFINQKMRLYVNKGVKEGYKLFDEAEAHGIADQSDNRGSMTFDYDGKFLSYTYIDIDAKRESTAN